MFLADIVRFQSLDIAFIFYFTEIVYFHIFLQKSLILSARSLGVSLSL